MQNDRILDHTEQTISIYLDALGRAAAKKVPKEIEAEAFARGGLRALEDLLGFVINDARLYGTSRFFARQLDRAAKLLGRILAKLG